MHPLLTTLAGKLVERWLALLVLPGALFLALAVSGVTLGHTHGHDVARLGGELDEFAVRPAADRPGAAVLLVAAVLLLSCAASLAGQFLGGAIERYWLRAPRDPLSHALVARRACEAARRARTTTSWSSRRTPGPRSSPAPRPGTG